jgi:hypothetical protein
MATLAHAVLPDPGIPVKPITFKLSLNRKSVIYYLRIYMAILGVRGWRLGVRELYVNKYNADALD